MREGGFLICSRTKHHRLASLRTGALCQSRIKRTTVFGVAPLAAIEFIVKSACFGRHPDFLQRLLQVDDDLAAVGKRQGNHAARALVVNVGIAGIVDAVACPLNGGQCLLGVV